MNSRKVFVDCVKEAGKLPLLCIRVSEAGGAVDKESD